MSERISAGSGRAEWIDFAKLVAIIAVLVDHTSGILYLRQDIHVISFFSVTLFIFLMGLTTFWSFSKINEHMLKKVLLKCWGIYRPYIAATLIFSIFIDRGFYFNQFLDRLIHFNASMPFYYVLLYIQLVIVSPLLISIFRFCDSRKCSLLLEFLFFCVITVFSVICTNRSDILSVFGGGGKLLGGTYLMVLYLGMWFAKYYNRINLNKKMSLVCFALCLLFLYFWYAKFYFLPFASDKLTLPGVNPPKLRHIISAVAIAFTVFFIFSLIDQFRLSSLSKVFSVFSALGRHTLYIFLYHRLFLDVIFPSFTALTDFAIENIWAKRVVYLICIIFGPLLIERIMKLLLKWLRKSYL